MVSVYLTSLDLGSPRCHIEARSFDCHGPINLTFGTSVPMWDVPWWFQFFVYTPKKGPRPLSRHSRYVAHALVFLLLIPIPWLIYWIYPIYLSIPYKLNSLPGCTHGLEDSHVYKLEAFLGLFTFLFQVEDSHWLLPIGQWTFLLSFPTHGCPETAG